MDITFHGTLEELDAFISRYRLPSKSVMSESSVAPAKSQMIEINGHKMALDTVPDALQMAIKKQIGAPAPIEAPPKSDILIPRFEWDKKAEKSYNTLFFFELPDGRAVLRYMSALTFVRKERVMQLPYPVPFGYSLLKDMSVNNRTAIRMYRQYLAELASPLKYIEKSTQDRIKENALQKLRVKGEPKNQEMKPKTKELQEMALGLGVR